MVFIRRQSFVIESFINGNVYITVYTKACPILCVTLFERLCASVKGSYIPKLTHV